MNSTLSSSSPTSVSTFNPPPSPISSSQKLKNRLHHLRVAVSLSNEDFSSDLAKIDAIVDQFYNHNPPPVPIYRKLKYSLANTSRRWYRFLAFYCVSDEKANTIYYDKSVIPKPVLFAINSLSAADESFDSAYITDTSRTLLEDPFTTTRTETTRTEEPTRSSFERTATFASNRYSNPSTFYYVHSSEFATTQEAITENVDQSSYTDRQGDRAGHRE